MNSLKQTEKNPCQSQEKALEESEPLSACGAGGRDSAHGSVATSRTVFRCHQVPHWCSLPVPQSHPRSRAAFVTKPRSGPRSSGLGQFPVLPSLWCLWQLIGTLVKHLADCPSVSHGGFQNLSKIYRFTGNVQIIKIINKIEKSKKLRSGRNIEKPEKKMSEN